MSNNNYYNQHVSELNAQYLAVKCEDVHELWLPRVTSKGYALDAGTGVGRDAAYLHQSGYKVVAIDPSEQMLAQAKRNYPALAITWLQDSLPSLSCTTKLKHKYSLILLSAVWMHVETTSRRRCIQKLSSMLAPQGKIVITLRHGSFTDGRIAYPVSAEELKRYAADFGLRYTLLSEGEMQADKSHRKGVSWETVELTLPDDGSGAFPLLRNIVINDAKAATYKVALLRSLLRIADGHPGAAIGAKSTLSHVALPFGLIAMYWLKLFKPLVDTYDMQQSSNAAAGLGFIKANGWAKLLAYSNNDFFVGAVHANNAKQIHSTFLHITSLINNMPAKYITLPGSDKRVFDIERRSPKSPKAGLVLDYDYLVSFGEFYIPREIWNTLSHFSCWIEPALVNEWVRIMQGFENNISQQFTLNDYYQALRWEDATRSTEAVRKRIDAVQKQTSETIHCTWSNKKISAKYDVDHTFPFARWPNNDLWNLTPTLAHINRKKSDKLVTNKAFLNAKEQILHFWKIAWKQEPQFFIQSNMALPDLARNNESFDDVFEAMLAQREHIKRVQQLRDWDGV